MTPKIKNSVKKVFYSHRFNNNLAKMTDSIEKVGKYVYVYILGMCAFLKI